MLTADYRDGEFIEGISVKQLCFCADKRRGQVGMYCGNCGQKICQSVLDDETRKQRLEKLRNKSLN